VLFIAFEYPDEYDCIEPDTQSSGGELRVCYGELGLRESEGKIGHVIMEGDDLAFTSIGLVFTSHQPTAGVLLSKTMYT
jgi:hypothetical protein